MRRLLSFFLGLGVRGGSLAVVVVVVFFRGFGSGGVWGRGRGWCLVWWFGGSGSLVCFWFLGSLVSSFSCWICFGGVQQTFCLIVGSAINEVIGDRGAERGENGPYVSLSFRRWEVLYLVLLNIYCLYVAPLGFKYIKEIIERLGIMRK